MECFVINTEQRKGIGSELLNKLKSNAESDGIKGFFLLTDKNTFANDFYRKYGFRTHEENVLMSHVFKC